MPDSPVLPALAKVVAGYFRLNPACVTAATTAMDVGGWDSVTHTLLLIEIEKHFHIRLDESEGFQVSNVGELAALVEKALTSVAR